MSLRLTERERHAAWAWVRDVVLGRLDRDPAGPIHPAFSPEEVRAYLARIDFGSPLTADAALRFAVEGFERFHAHPDHPSYMGRFNPAPSDMSVLADALVAAFNPQLAAWSYGAFAIEAEQLMIREFGRRFGWATDAVEGTFASGGAEANHTAVLVALTHGTDGFPERGLAVLPARPVVYVATEGHHSVRKAGRLTGLGDDAVVAIGVDAGFRMDTGALRVAIARDRREGRQPLMVVATAGTTGSGAVDPIGAIADIAREQRLWLHVDAAWGGPLVLLEEKRRLLAGIEHADSITFDAHKMLSVPMGAGIFVTRHRGLLRRTFGLDTGYMPPEAGGVEPYATSLQWSRRAIGMKLFLTLAVAGWHGYEAAIRGQLGLLDRLVAGLAPRGWRVVNDPSAGVACFVDGTGAVPDDRLPEVAARTVAGGRAWITHARIGDGRTVLRACITNHRTRVEHVDRLLDALDDARASVA
jgi:glutamate/tyrosine decarboxylase-like PLP-dependent enzyme